MVGVPVVNEVKLVWLDVSIADTMLELVAEDGVTNVVLKLPVPFVSTVV